PFPYTTLFRSNPNLAEVFACILAAIAYIEQLRVRIVGHTVRTQLQLDGIKQLEGVTAEYPEHSVVSAGHKHFVERFHVRDTLRLLKPWDAFHPLARLQIHDFERTVL